MTDTTLSGQLVQKITLDQLKFFAYHGYYPEERETGNEFWVTVSITFPLAEFRKEQEQDDLDKTINYETIFEIVEAEMNLTRKLLETVCQQILQRILAQFSFVEKIEVTIRKSKLPFGNEDVNASVSLAWNR